jgi:hypothetical protein
MAALCIGAAAPGAATRAFDRNLLPDPVNYFESEGLALAGSGKWRTTRCDFHGGTNSMRVNTQTGAWVCMSCFRKGGDVLAYHMAAHDIDFVSAAVALGAMRARGAAYTGNSRPRALSAAETLEVLHEDALVVWVCAQTMLQFGALDEGDRRSLTSATRRFVHLVGARA